MVEYYSKIVSKIKSKDGKYYSPYYNERYYIQKVKPFFVEHRVYYEITFSTALSNASKFDRIIAFSTIDIPENYAIKIKVRESNIDVLNKTLPILIIDDFFISIRPCEFENFSDIFGPRIKCNTGGKEYQQLMLYIKNTGVSLTELLSLEDNEYNHAKGYILSNAKANTIFTILDEARRIVVAKLSASNILKYLLYRMNNKVIRWQLSNVQCDFLSNLYLRPGCGVFDKMPLNSSLANHNPLFRDLMECIGFDGREHELFARKIRTNTEKEATLYTSMESLRMKLMLIK